MTDLDRNDLDSWLAAARSDLAARTPPAWVQQQLEARLHEQLALQAVRQSAAVRQARPHHAGVRRMACWIGAPAALALTLLMAIALPALLAPGETATPATAEPRFIALAPLEEIAAERSALVIPGEVPRSQLGEYGLPVDPARADEPARAEFLMSARGVVLAVRFVE
jgi:hypothetical protein